MSRTNQKVLTATVALMLLAAVVSASDLRPGEAVLGTLAPDAAQAFSMDCAAGDAVQITLKARGAGDAAPSITIRGPSGDTVAAARGGRKLKARFTAPRTGSYEVRIAALAGSSARYRMKVKGESKRAHAAAGDEIRFGAPSGAEVRFKVKTAGTPNAEMRDSRNHQVALLQNGARFRSVVLEATDEYRITAPGASKIKVKVLYADSRGALVVESPGSPYDAPAAVNVPGGGSDANDDSQDPADQGDGTEPAPDGEVTDPANDGSVGGNGGSGTVPAPAFAADHAYLTVLLDAAEDVDIQKARIEMGAALDQLPADVAAELRGRFMDAAAHEVAEALLALGDEMVGAEARAYALDILAAQRRVERAHARLALLNDAIAGSALAGDPIYDAGIGVLAAAMAETEAAVAQAIESGLARRVRGEQDAEAASLDAPAAPAATAELHTGLAALDAAVAQALMLRARAAEREAIEALRLLTEQYDRQLAATPAVDGNAAATRAALVQRLAELRSLAADRAEFDLAVEPMAAPQAGQDSYEIMVRSPGADGRAIDWNVTGDFLWTRAEANGLRIAVAGHDDERMLEVRAELAGESRVLEIRVQPEPAADEAPAAMLAGVVLGDDDQPIAALPVAIVKDDQIVAQGETDAQGRFEIECRAEGDHDLRVGDLEMAIQIAPGVFQDLGPIRLN